MGRYYSGDIEGKFWFGVQSSNDASFFGGIESEPNYLEYYFSAKDLPKIMEGIKKCDDALGEWKPKLDEFFREHNGYNEAMLKEAGIPSAEIRALEEWYARLLLGEKILQCVVDKAECCFEAEL